MVPSALDREVIGEVELGWMVAAHHADEAAIVPEHLDAVVHRIGDVDAPIMPGQPLRALELARLDAEAAEARQRPERRRECLHPVGAAIFGDVEVADGIGGDPDLEEELRRTAALAADEAGDRAVGGEQHHAMVMGVRHRDPPVGQLHHALRPPDVIGRHGPLADERAAASGDHDPAGGIQDPDRVIAQPAQPARGRLGGRHRRRVPAPLLVEAERRLVAAARQAEGEGEEEQQAGPRRHRMLRRRDGPDLEAHAAPRRERIDGAVDEGAGAALRGQRRLDLGVGAVERGVPHDRAAGGILADEQAFRSHAADDRTLGEPGLVLGGEPVRLAQAGSRLAGGRPVIEVVHRAMHEQPAFVQADHLPGQADHAVRAVRAA